MCNTCDQYSQHGITVIKNGVTYRIAGAEYERLTEQSLALGLTVLDENGNHQFTSLGNTTKGRKRFDKMIKSFANRAFN